MSNQAQINKVKEDLLATARSLVHDVAVQIEFDENCRNNFFSWNQKLIAGEKNFLLPEINENFADENLIKNARAASDMALCYFLFHDDELHQQKKFDAEEQKIFDEFEKMRVIANVENIYLGALKNILQKLEDEASIAPESISLLLLNCINAKNILPKTKNLLGEIAKKTSAKISAEIKKLAENISDQTSFALGVERLLEMMREEIEVSDQNDGEEKNQQKENELENFGSENIEQDAEENIPQDGEEASSQKEQKEEKVSELKEGDAGGKASIKLDKSSAKEEGIEFKNAYKIFTSQFDEVVFPQKLISKKELEILYDQLELKMTKLSDISRKASLKFKKKLLSKRNASLEFDATRGILNRKKLTRLVIDPTIEDIWINSHEHEYQNTALTILLDNSGSMRGAPIVMSALACKMIAEILEKFAVKTEIIGFTTADWKGGRARKIWEANGRPKNPGRLNELRHIIYKPFNSNFKKSKINLGLMLKEGILKENIDGEALLFARARLMQQSEKRKILMVISDGTPIDDSTLAVNDSDILSDHLHHVVKKIEKSGKVEIVGIGIGHDTKDFYRNSVTIKNLEELSDVMIEKLCAAL